MDDNDSTERLREVLLDLEQAQRRDRALRMESDALLSGLRALSEANTPEDLFLRILEALREPLAFEAAFVLRPNPSLQGLACTAATDPRFLGSAWTMGRAFTRVLHAGRVVVHLDTSNISEWCEQPDAVRRDVGSAVCIPLLGSSETALLVCTRKETRAFQPTHERLAKRFQPLATQALRDVERVAQVERTNEEMRFVLEFNRAIVENAADGIVTADKDGFIKSWNASAEHIFSVAAGDAIGKSFTDFIKCGVRRRSEVTITRADGSVTQVDVRVTAVQITDGVMHIAFVRDLAEEKHAARMLSDLHMQLVDASRLAGMADVASGILHNVGNVLNSVKVSATILNDTVRHSSVESVGKLGALLRDNKDDLAAFLMNDSRGKRVPELIEMIAAKLFGERDKLLTEIQGLRNNIEHICEIVSMQQQYTQKSGIEEHVQLLDTINDAVEMSVDSKAGDRIEVVRELEPLPIMLLDRHLAMQILVNLLRNARHAVRDSQRSDPCITVRATTCEGLVTVVIEDNGVGIDPVFFERLFQQGFTTKKGGHGYGLHSSANAAKALGGTLSAMSAGNGLGARFVLELPFTPVGSRA